jgi:predicted Holliday junction resolvase-like endonuclease
MADEKLQMNNSRMISKDQVLQFLVAFFFTAFGVLAAYYTTIAGIRLDLSRKAETEMVNQLDKKLCEIEVILNDNFMTKKEFMELKEDLDKRLTKIEYRLKIKQ